MKQKIIKGLIFHINFTINELQKQIAVFRSNPKFQNLDVVTANMQTTIRQWIEFRTFVKANQNLTHDKVEDGAIVRLNDSQWCYIYKFSTEFSIDHDLIFVDPGNFKSCHSIQGATSGDLVKLEGDGRAIPDRTFKISEIL